MRHLMALADSTLHTGTGRVLAEGQVCGTLPQEDANPLASSAATAAVPGAGSPRPGASRTAWATSGRGIPGCRAAPPDPLDGPSLRRAAAWASAVAPRG